MNRQKDVSNYNKRIPLRCFVFIALFLVIFIKVSYLCRPNSKQMGMDASVDYYNNHTNIFGATKYTKFVASYISENYNLPDRRNDPAYASWHEGYSVWSDMSHDNKEAILKIIAAKEEQLSNGE